MPISADTSDAPRFIRITVSGEWPSPDERTTLRRMLVDDRHIQADTRALVDLRGLTSLPPPGDADAIIATARREGGLTRLHAYVVASADQTVLARRLKQSAGPGTIVEIFNDLQEAETWLWNAEPDW